MKHFKVGFTDAELAKLPISGDTITEFLNWMVRNSDQYVDDFLLDVERRKKAEMMANCVHDYSQLVSDPMDIRECGHSECRVCSKCGHTKHYEWWKSV